MKKQVRTVLKYVLVISCTAIWLLPIYWMVATSFKPTAEIYRNIPTLFPQNPTLESYRYLFQETRFLNGVRNSLIVALTVAAFSMLIGYPASYAIARLRFRMSRPFATILLLCYLIPSSVLYIPLYNMVNKMGLSNSLPALMVIYPVFTLPYVAWVLTPHIQSVSRVIEEASIIDGCTRVQRMYRIVLPAVFPGLVSTFIFAFTLCWGEYLYALVNILSEESKTYPLIITSLIYGDLYPWNQIMAAGTLA
ncbi:MAG TPA: carbohydrate ABC transporter permease, partial [Lachnospiraceae bacterium]|nr:carbohydrate ABC transporter permease [Lachnospiraceae bacterium]